MGKDVIIALDFDSREKTLAFLDRFTEEKPFVKVGMELFTRVGPGLLEELSAMGFSVFLDVGNRHCFSSGQAGGRWNLVVRHKPACLRLHP
mgnify:CR=1 FL=1